MDWKRLDLARGASGPVEVDLIEAYAQGRIKRRDFVKRGTIIGLSVPFMGAIIAACGSDDGVPATHQAPVWRAELNGNSAILLGTMHGGVEAILGSPVKIGFEGFIWHFGKVVAQCFQALGQADIKNRVGEGIDQCRPRGHHA